MYVWNKILHTSAYHIGPAPKKPNVSLGKMQDLMIEALDGFVLVLLFDGTIIYLSENVNKYLGLFQVRMYMCVSVVCTYMYRLFNLCS